MSLRKSGKVLTVVGFVICLSCMGILYGNLSSISLERDEILANKNKEIANLRAQVENKDTSLFAAQNRISMLVKEADQYQQLQKRQESEKDELEKEVGLLQDKVKNVEDRAAQKSQDIIHLDSDMLQKSGEIEKLKVRVDELDEGGKACSGSVAGLQVQLNQQTHYIVQLKEQLLACGEAPKEKEKSEKEKDSDSKFEAVVAVPQHGGDAAGNQGNSGNQGNHAPVAAVPVQQDNNNLVDNKQDIPGAQAPPPQPAPDNPVGGNHGNSGETHEEAVAAAPVPAGQGNPVLASGNHGNSGNPVLAAPEQAVAQAPEPLQAAPAFDERRDLEPQNQEQLQDAVDTVREQQQEQLEHLQQEQQQQNPVLEPGPGL